MKGIKIYALVWLIAAAAAAIAVYLNGFFNPLMQALFGVILATLLAAGHLIVLPLWVNEQSSPKALRK